MPMLKNPKFEAFAQSIVNGKNLVDSARAAGYKESRAGTTGSELRKNPDVAARITELQIKRSAIAESHGVFDMRMAIAECDEARDLARTQGQSAAMIQATTLKAKLTGLLVERRQVDYKNVGELSDAELESLIQSAEATAAGKRAIEKASELESETVPADNK
jgi:CHAT domain-containing protein